jgi:hypothetical protein
VVFDIDAVETVVRHVPLNDDRPFTESQSQYFSALLIRLASRAAAKAA